MAERRRTARRWAWAAALGLAAPAAAWGQYAPGPGAYGRPAEAPVEGPGLAALIELELLADPRTFSYAFTVQVGPDVVDLRGYVPNAWVRDAALKRAQAVSPLPLRDGLVVQPNLLIPLPRALGPEAAADIRRRIEGVDLQALSPIQVKVLPHGQIQLQGRVGSMADKLQLSRCLRGLAGCAAVRNDVQIGAAVVRLSPPPAAPRESVQARPPAEVTPVAVNPAPRPPIPVRSTALEGVVLAPLPAPPAVKETPPGEGAPAVITFDDPPEK